MSYERFLQMDLLPNEREDIGLQTVFNSVFPIFGFSRRQRTGIRRLFHRNWEASAAT